MGLNPIVSLSPYILISLFLLFLGEGVKDQTTCHPNETDKEGEVISFGWIRISNTGEGLNNFS